MIKRIIHTSALYLASIVILLFSMHYDIPHVISELEDKQPVVTYIGTPTAEYYVDKHFNARNPWDMVVSNGQLYIGAGDYDTNSGITPIYRYSIANEVWDISGFVNSESITKFTESNGIIYAPGIDPTDSTGFGCCAALSGGEWITYNGITNTVHNYDVIEYDGKMIFAIGTDKSNKYSPVKHTTDGVNFTDIPFYDNGVDVIKKKIYTFARVYDFYTINGNLYCSFKGYSDKEKVPIRYCKFVNGAFVFLNSSSDEFPQHWNYFQDYSSCGKATIKNECYFTTGNLYKTADFVNFSEIKTPDDAAITDIITEKDKNGLETLYILGSKKIITETDGETITEYMITVWRLDEGGNMDEVFSFSSDEVALSFAKHNNLFFVGIGRCGKYETENKKIGKIYKIELP